jgi:hypothetical protein
MGFIRETPTRHFVGVLCVISADPTTLLPVKLLAPKYTAVLISQSIYIELVECPFEKLKKYISPHFQRLLQLICFYILRIHLFRGTLAS